MEAEPESEVSPSRPDAPPMAGGSRVVLIQSQAALVVLPYLRAYDTWQRNTHPDAEDPLLVASRAAVVGAAGRDGGSALRSCIEVLTLQHGEEAAARAASSEPAGI
eukprot:COSAG05_NODE_13735_length_419_cov_1.618750_1_plen_105_part_10